MPSLPDMPFPSTPSPKPCISSTSEGRKFICTLNCGHLNNPHIVPGTYECQGALCQLRVKTNVFPVGSYIVSPTDATNAQAKCKQPHRRQLILGPLPSWDSHQHDISQIPHLSYLRPNDDQDLFVPSTDTPSIMDLRQKYAVLSPSFGWDGHRPVAPLQLPEPKPMSLKKKRILQGFGLTEADFQHMHSQSDDSCRTSSPSSSSFASVSGSGTPSPRTPASASSIFSLKSSFSQSSRSMEPTASPNSCEDDIALAPNARPRRPSRLRKSPPVLRQRSHSVTHNDAPPKLNPSLSLAPPLTPLTPPPPYSSDYVRSSPSLLVPASPTPPSERKGRTLRRTRRFVK